MEKIEEDSMIELIRTHFRVSQIYEKWSCKSRRKDHKIWGAFWSRSKDNPTRSFSNI